MKTKLEVGKEYWLGESKKFKGIYKGSLGKAHYFYITYGDDNFTHDANGFVEFPLHGVFEIEQWQFTTPIAMKCTEEQFNGIKDKLVEMGYIFYGITFGEKYRYLSSNFAKDKRCITDLAIGSKYFKECSPIIFESFNPDLFLALAAMTDKEDGINGEWWMHPLDFKLCTFESYDIGQHAPVFRKATAQEIIEHFEKKEFVLPERWCVKVGDLDANEIILKWRRENTKYKYYSGSIGYIDCDGYFTENHLYQEITFDQFKKYVLKETEQSCQNEVEFTGIPVPMFDPITGNIYPNYSCCQKTPSISSIEYSVNVEFDAEKAAEEIFAKIVGLGKSHQPEFKFAWEPCKEKIEKFENFLGSFDPFINIKNTDKTIIPIPPTKQATIFDDRVEITDWKPKEGEYCDEVYLHENGKFHYRHIKYEYKYLDKFNSGLIKKNGEEADKVRTKLNQAML